MLLLAMFAHRTTIRVRSAHSTSPETIFPCSRSSLPVIVNASPDKSSNRHLSPPSILRKSHETLNSNMSSLHNIHTTFFKELIRQCGTNTVSAVTQCVLDLGLIVSVHASLAELHRSINDAEDDYRHKYLQMIDPTNCTVDETHKTGSSSTGPEIFTFHQAIKQRGANIRSAQCKEYLPLPITSSYSSILAMRHLIASLFPKPVRLFFTKFRQPSSPFRTPHHHRMLSKRRRTFCLNPTQPIVHLDTVLYRSSV